MNDKYNPCTDSSYPPIEEYGFISDCHSMALVCTSGSIDWCVMPRVDAYSVFGRILDWNKGGYCRISPDLETFSISRKYIDGSLVLKTTITAEKGEVNVYDCFTMRTGGREKPYNQIIRIVEGTKGVMPMRFSLVPRFEYGMLKPWIRRCNNGKDLVALGGHQGLLISSSISLNAADHVGCSTSFPIHSGERKYISIIYRLPHLLDTEDVEVPDEEEVFRRFEKTVEWWRRWSGQAAYDGPFREQVLRSAVVLKGLTNAPTGAIAAAATTSLPEDIGGSRNWDYRFTWVRDSVFTVRSLALLGFRKEAEGFRRFIERTAAGEAEEVQVLFGVGGEYHEEERELSRLEGYRGSKPVRIGNAASQQMQHDVYGELLDLSYSWHRWGNSSDDDYWDFIIQLVDITIDVWRKPDHGIWEVRGKPRHFVQSKVMCWVALDRGIRLAEETGRKVDLHRWESERSAIHEWIEKNGYDRDRGVYIQSPESKVMDASLLLLPVFRYVTYTDERMIKTVDAIRSELGREEGLIMRYPHDNDGLEGHEGTFICCTFWLAEVLARQRRLDEARAVFNYGCSTANDLQLYSEQFDAEKNIMLGNFPQGLTHLSLITAAVAINDVEKGDPAVTTNI